jgi:DNA-binding transcriptional regulator GbsR (MarR family)
VENNILTMPPVKDTPFTKGGSLSVKKQKALRAAPGADLQTSPPAPLSAFQLQSVALFIHVFGALSLPRSIGEIYGLLFSTPEPLSLDDVQSRLQLSRGSASEGLRWLRSLGAVNQVYLAGIRKEHFTAETSLRKLASGYLRDRIDPHLENGPNRLSILESSIGPTSATAHFEKSRLGQIAGWYKFFAKVLPLIKALAGKF